MKLFLLVFVFCLTLIYACGNPMSKEIDDSPKTDSTEHAFIESIALSKEEMEGADVEMEVAGADFQNGIVSAWLINRRNTSIKNIRGFFVPFDVDNAVVIFANGTPKTSAFQRLGNPYIVPAKSKVFLDFNNRLDPRTMRVEVNLEVAE
jgi:hypothetical protein